MERKQRRLPEEVLNQLRNGWVRYGEIQSMCEKQWKIARVKAVLAPLLLALHARRFAAHPYVWYTLCPEAEEPPRRELMSARSEWNSTPLCWRRTHPVTQIADPYDYIHAMLLGALAYQGDEAALVAFEKLRRKTRAYRVVRGRGNPLDVFIFGEHAKELDDAEQ